MLTTLSPRNLYFFGVIFFLGKIILTKPKNVSKKIFVKSKIKKKIFLLMNKLFLKSNFLNIIWLNFWVKTWLGIFVFAEISLIGLQKIESSLEIFLM